MKIHKSFFIQGISIVKIHNILNFFDTASKFNIKF